MITTTLDRDTEGFCSLKVLRFAEIPEEFQTAETAKQWLMHKEVMSNETLSACYEEIPLALRSFEVMLYAAKTCNVNVLMGLSATQTPGYVFLAEAVTRRNYKAIASVDPEVLWQILPDFCWNNIDTIDEISKEFDWFRGALSKETFDKCCMNVEFALDSPIEKIPENLLREMIVKNYSAYPAFRKRGLFHVMADRITAGDWPPVSSDYGFYADKPLSLNDGISLLKEQEPGSDHETLYMAYAMTHPIEQVVPQMRDRELKVLLAEMYTLEELKPFMKADRELRGVMLEDGLGL
jgi:hypothetical protein